MQSLQAFERVQLARGTANAIALAFSAKDGELPSGLTGDLRDAFLLPPE